MPSELSFEDVWDGEAMSELVRSKSEHGEIPTFLFLGRKEVQLLKEYLAEVFGEESVINLHGTYYMGLDIVTVDCETFLSIGGRKVSQASKDLEAPRPAWRDLDSEGKWKFRV